MAEGGSLKTCVRQTVLALLLLATAGASAFGGRPPVIVPEVADLTSRADRMISYRHQEHLWQTSDGGLHIVVNRGTQTGLALFSSFDLGATWYYQLAFDATDDQTTGDGQLRADVLSFAYETSSGMVAHAELQYDPTYHSWAVIGQSVVFSSVAEAAFNPACGIDAVGNVWCGFVAHDRVSGNNRIAMSVRPATSTAWIDTGLTHGPIDKQSVERSARPVRAGDVMGMVYTVRNSTFWAYRADASPLDSPWEVDLIYTNPSPQKRITDFYASHFSIVADDAGKLHMLFADDFDSLYFRREPGGGWTAPVALNATGKASYGQIGLVNGNIAAAYSMHTGNGQYQLSTDGGLTFRQTAALSQPTSSGTVRYGTPRIEMPTRTTGPANPVLQQFSDGPVQKLLVYKVPAP